MDTSTTKSNDTIAANEKKILQQLESELTQSSISELLAKDPSLLGGDDVAELLQQLSNADDMAQGMESKLDSVLQNLDDLLALVGAEVTPTTSQGVGSTTSGDPAEPDVTKTSPADP